mmetsp:Transcript_39767/g.98517  ORF Transcript_39767/g.98517 Transcript_39767/m.98517 type:complete len:124 (-) Transcript_39767:158-529(-)
MTWTQVLDIVKSHLRVLSLWSLHFSTRDVAVQPCYQIGSCSNLPTRAIYLAIEIKLGSGQIVILRRHLGLAPAHYQSVYQSQLEPALLQLERGSQLALRATICSLMKGNLHRGSEPQLTSSSL